MANRFAAVFRKRRPVDTSEELWLDLMSDPIAYLIVYRRLSENLEALRVVVKEGETPTDAALLLLSDDLRELGSLHPLGLMAERIIACQLSD